MHRGVICLNKSEVSTKQDTPKLTQTRRFQSCSCLPLLHSASSWMLETMNMACFTHSVARRRGDVQSGNLPLPSPLAPLPRAQPGDDPRSVYSRHRGGFPQRTQNSRAHVVRTKRVSPQVSFPFHIYLPVVWFSSWIRN